MIRRITLALLAVGVTLALTACLPLPEKNKICNNPGEFQRRGDEIWQCTEQLSEKMDGKYVSRWYKLHTPPAVIPSGR